MVVIGGAGSRWGAMLGGILYTYLDHRLAALGELERGAGPAEVLRTPLAEPLFVLGVALHPRSCSSSRAGSPGSRRGRAAARAAPARGGDVPAARSATPRPREPEALRSRRAGSGAPLLLIQGLGYAARGWGPRATCSRAASACHARQPRHRRERVRPARTRRRSLRGTPCAVLDDAGVERAHVLGISLGGMIAQELVLAQPERVDRLVLGSHDAGRGRLPSRCRSRPSR